jgi:hypothetical protein
MQPAPTNLLFDKYRGLKNREQFINEEIKDLFCLLTLIFPLP